MKTKVISTKSWLNMKLSSKETCYYLGEKPKNDKTTFPFAIAAQYAVNESYRLFEDLEKQHLRDISFIFSLMTHAKSPFEDTGISDLITNELKSEN